MGDRDGVGKRREERERREIEGGRREKRGKMIGEIGRWSKN